MVTIKDISDKTGYSVSTVSRALNNKPRVAAQTRKHILAVAKDLNYIPNNQAISLSTGKSYNIGVIIPYGNSDNYYDSLITAIISQCFKHKYRASFLPTNFNQKQELEYLNLFAAQEFDGLIITSTSLPYHEIEKFLKYGPIISCEFTENSKVPYVKIKKDKIHERIINQLKSENINKMACTFSRSPDSNHEAQSIFNVFNRNLKNFNQKYTYANCKNYQDGFDAAKYFFMHDPAITCIFANNDEVAAGMLDFHYQTKTKQPPFIIGENNSVWSKALNISTIHHKIDCLGKIAVDMCLANNKDNKIIESEFIDRRQNKKEIPC